MNSPRLRAVFVDDHGVPVSLGRQELTPARHDPVALQRALLRLAAGPPGEHHPSHPGGHQPPPATSSPPTTAPPPGHGSRPSSPSSGAPASPSSPCLQHPHDGGAGTYSIRPALRELLALRAPRDEWPGSGVRASRCDLDHDTAWPDGPTCACNLGPLSRRHHRIKQLGWGKQRQADGSVRWTSQTGRTWTSPSQLPPVPDTLGGSSDGTGSRAPRPVFGVADREARNGPWTAQDEWEAPNPAQQHAELLAGDPSHPDHRVEPSDLDWRLADPDVDPLGHLDPVGDALRERRTAWDLDLRDPYRWDPALALPDPQDDDEPRFDTEPQDPDQL